MEINNPEVITTLLSVILSSMALGFSQRKQYVSEYIHSDNEIRNIAFDMLRKGYLHMDNYTGLIQLSEPVEVILTDYNVIKKA